uniref:CS domain-containing protein n=1 Tax=Coccolithus braarudii TaxID=221442 RepID=A0A7S0Q5W8_9EUKA
MLDAYLAQLQAVVAARAAVSNTPSPSDVDMDAALPLPSSISSTSSMEPQCAAAVETESIPLPPAQLKAVLPVTAPVTAPVVTPVAAPLPVRLTPSVAASSSEPVRYSPIPSYGWDQDGYGKDPNNVYVYVVHSIFEGIGEHKECVQCSFTTSSFDLKILGFKGKNYRLNVPNLDKEIDPAMSKALVKKDSIKIKMRKVKGQYGYDSWLDLSAKRSGGALAKDKDPGEGLMDMMKQMYDDGDDQMKKTLGEAMLKSRQDQMRGGASSSLPSGDDDF